MNQKTIGCLVGTAGALLLIASNGYSFTSYGNSVNTACAPATPFTGNCSLCHVSDRSVSTPATTAFLAGGDTLTDFFCPAPACTDADNDTFAIEGGDCGPIDCNDSDPAIHPNATDTPDNGIDENCDGSDAISSIPAADNLLINFPGYGLYSYNSTSKYTLLNTVDAPLSVTADIDADGVDEVVSFFEGYGLYTWDNGTWTIMTTAKPEELVRFGNGLAIDLGDYGLFTYDSTNKWRKINDVSPTSMVSVDVDSDGSMELTANFAGYGLYIFDNGTWTLINSVEPDMITAGKTLVP